MKKSRVDRKINKNSIILGAIGLILGFSFGYCIKKTTEISNTFAIRDNSTQYKFVKPLLAVGSSDTMPSPADEPLYNSVQNYIKTQSSIGDNTSVYFIDYANGGRFSINEKDLYSPSSLMKVVVMIAYLKKAETDSSILSTKMQYQKDMQAALDSVSFGTPSTLVVGDLYTVSDLINDMIASSDNGAMNVLIDNLGYTSLDAVYTDLGLTAPTQTQTDYKISASDYSLFFRILYNATYLGPDMSEKALSILSKATFADGLTAPLPKGTLVAHKFGEHVYGTASLGAEAVELHDCGIVYLSHGGPYFLCIMTHGSSLDALEERIQGISSLVYNTIVSDDQKNSRE